MCGAPANTEGWRDPGLFHSAVLSNLSPGTLRFALMKLW
jgi:hypothetical protein